MKYTTVTRALTARRKIENIDLSLSEILPVYLADRLYLLVAVTGSKYVHIWWGSGAIEN